MPNSWYVCEECGVVYLNLHAKRAVTDGADEDGRVFYVCTMMNLNDERCGGRIFHHPMLVGFN
jgi:hypothetical protein